MNEDQKSLDICQNSDTIQSMNLHDRSNFQFLMTRTEAEFAVWFNKSTKDDIAYAMQLFAEALNELRLRVTSHYDVIEDFTEARSILSKFTLKQGE